MSETIYSTSSTTAIPAKQCLIQLVWARPSGQFGMVTLLLMLIVAVGAPWLAPFDPDAQFNGLRLLSFNTDGHWLGTDDLSRDILSRVIFGTRVSLWVGFVCVGVGSVLGVLAGLLSAMSGPKLDTVIMRICDILLAYPGILLGIMVVAVLGPGLNQIGVAVAFVNLPIFARLMRASVLREKELDYVRAAKVQGCGLWRLMIRHILPNSLGGVIPQLATAAGHAVLLEASLSFIGLGIKPPTPSWGGMLNQSRDFLMTTPLYAVVPGSMLLLLVFSMNQLGDAVQSAMNPVRGA